jgi:hypothetical protein
MKESQSIVASVEETKGDAHRPKRLFPPSLLSRKLLCPAFVPKPYEKETRELRHHFDILARMSITKTIMDLTRKGYRFIEDEKPSGQFTGTVDLVFESPDGLPTKVEVKSSKYLKLMQILQSILYHEPGDKILVAAFNEVLEPSDWLIELVKSTAAELNEFLQEYAEQATRVCIPLEEVCERCINSKCFRRIGVAQRDHRR